MSITFKGQRSSGINLYTPLWHTSLSFTTALWSTSCLEQSQPEGTMSPGGQLWLQSDPCSLLAGSQVLFYSIFGADCSMVSWLIVILINGWQWLDSCPNTGSIASPSLQPAPLPSSSGTERGLSMKFSSHYTVYTLQPLPDPVNVLSVSSHTGSLHNDPVVTSCTIKGLCPLPLNYLQRFSNQMTMLQGFCHTGNMPYFLSSFGKLNSLWTICSKYECIF